MMGAFLLLLLLFSPQHDDSKLLTAVKEIDAVIEATSLAEAAPRLEALCRTANGPSLSTEPFDALVTIYDRVSSWVERSGSLGFGSALRGLQSALLVQVEARAGEGASLDGVNAVLLFLHGRGLVERTVAVIDRHLTRILALPSGPRSYYLFFLSDATRVLGDWSRCEEALDRLDQSAREAPADHALYCERRALSERIFYLASRREIEQARPVLDRYVAQPPLAGDELRSVYVRVHFYTVGNNPREVVRVLDEYAAESDARLDTTLSLYRAGARFRLAREQGDPLADPAAELERALESAPAWQQERFPAATFLFEYHLGREDWDGCARALAHAERSEAACYPGLQIEAETRWRPLFYISHASSMRAIYAVATHQPRSILQRSKDELGALLDQILSIGLSGREQTSQPSSIGYLDEETAIFGALLAVQSALEGSAGVEATADQFARFQNLSAICRQLEAEPGSVASYCRRMLGSDDQGVLIFLSIPAFAGGCAVIGFDRRGVQAERIGTMTEWVRRLRDLQSALHESNAWDPERWRRLSREFLGFLLPALCGRDSTPGNA